MATARYRNFIQLLEKWPVDKSRGKRDLGAFVRRRVVEGFSHGETTQVNAAECDKVYTSLYRISSDYHSKAWKRSSETSASGATAEDLSFTLSDEGLKELSGENDKGAFRKLREQIFSREQ